MSPEERTPHELWARLRSGAPQDGGLGVPTIVTDTLTREGPVRLALGPNREPRLLLSGDARRA